MMMNGRSSSRYPFTPSQWQELEHQALIFKYMATGIPIPPDLILPIRRSFLLDSTIASPTLAFPPQPSRKLDLDLLVAVSWGWSQMGFSRKAEDPEPGRCRRTDGKKWRCAKEAYPDSKYCERHMHRGKNRSRKPVEMSLATSLPSSTSTSTNSTSHTLSPYPPPSLSISTPDSYHPLYPCHSSSRPPVVGLSTPHFNLDTPSYTQADKDHRYCHGMKDVDEYSFFTEASGSERESSWQFRPLGMSSLGETKQGTSALQQSTYPHRGRDEEEKQQHCFILGTDFKLERPVKSEREHEGQRPLRHFFDEWPQKNRDSWLDLEQENSNQAAAYSKTQLSISIPMSNHDFPVTSSRYRNDD